MASYNEQWKLPRQYSANYAEHMFRDFSSMCSAVAYYARRRLRIERQPTETELFFLAPDQVGPTLRREYGQHRLDLLRLHNRGVQLALAMRRLPEGAREGNTADRAYFAAVCHLYERLRLASPDPGDNDQRTWLMQDPWKERHPYMIETGMVTETKYPSHDEARDTGRHLREAARIMVDELTATDTLEPPAAHKALAQAYLTWNMGRLDEADAHLSLREPYHRDNWGWDVGFNDLRVHHRGQELEVNVSDDSDDFYTIPNMPTDLSAGDVTVVWNDPRARQVLKVTSDHIKIGVTSGNGRATRTVRVQGA